MKNENNTVTVYANGIISCSVCADDSLTVEDVELTVNAINPTGISSLWKVSKDKTFKDGSPNPCKCNDSECRTHYLMNC